MTHHLSAPPDAAFWLDELRLADFEDAIALLHDPELLRSALDEEFSGPTPRKALDAMLAAGDPDLAAAHALLVARFLRQKKSAAVADVATAALSPDELAEWTTPTGRLQRLPTTLRPR